MEQNAFFFFFFLTHKYSKYWHEQDHIQWIGTANCNLLAMEIFSKSVGQPRPFKCKGLVPALLQLYTAVFNSRHMHKVKWHAHTNTLRVSDLTKSTVQQSVCTIHTIQRLFYNRKTHGSCFFSMSSLLIVLTTIIIEPIQRVHLQQPHPDGISQTLHAFIQFSLPSLSHYHSTLKISSTVFPHYSKTKSNKLISYTRVPVILVLQQNAPCIQNT